MIPNRDSLQEFSAGCFFVCFGRGENKRNYSSDEKENGCIPDVTIGIIDVLRDKKIIIGEGMCVKTCVVCGMQLPDEAMVCSRCGFPMHQRAFLSEAHYRAWMREVIEPCRIDWHRRDIEQQRKQLKEQQRQIEEQRRKLEEQQKSKKEPERPAQNRRTEWNTADRGWNQTAKEQKPKKKGGLVKNALIVLGVFTAASLLGRAVFAPSMQPSSSTVSSAETQSYVEASIDAEAEPVTLSQEQLDKAAEVGFDLNLFEKLPLTSREDILAWLDENKYQYKESSGESNWTVDIRTDEGSLVSVTYEGQTSGTQANYLLHYNYHEGYREDETYYNTVKQLMQELHKEGSVQEDYAIYYDNAETDTVWKAKVEKVVLRKAKQSEIDEQADQLVRVLNEMPEIKEKQETLDWIAKNSDSYEDDPEYSWCNVDLGIWSATYFYEDFWHFEVYAGNAKRYYETVCEKFKDAGFEQGKETKQDNRRSIYYTLSGKWSIQVEYNPIYHHIELYCNPL